MAADEAKIPDEVADPMAAMEAKVPDEVKSDDEADEVKRDAMADAEADEASERAALEAQAVEDAAAAEVRAQEAEDFALAVKLAETSRPRSPPPWQFSAHVVVHVCCVSGADLGRPTVLELETVQLHVVVGLADGETVASEDRTLAVEANVEAKTGAWGEADGTVRFVVPRVETASLRFALYRATSTAGGCDDCCHAAFLGLDEPPVALGTVATLPLASKAGEASDWADGAPRDHHLDSGAVLTVTTTVLPGVR